MKENIYDKVTTKIEQRLTRAMGKIDKQFKGVNPYGYEKIKPMDLVAKYMNMLPEAREAVMQANPEGWRKYENDVLKIMEGMKNG